MIDMHDPRSRTEFRAIKGIPEMERERSKGEAQREGYIA